MVHATKDKGDIAVAKTIASLMLHDIRVCMPMSEHLPFDLIAVYPDLTTLKRVQVKYRAMKSGKVDVPFRSNYYNSKRIYSVPVNMEHIDTYAIYCPDTDKTYYLETSEIPAGSLRLVLRVESARNGQVNGIRYATHYEHPPPSSLAIPPTGGDYSRPDELALTRVMVDLTSKGIYVCLPLGNSLPFHLLGVWPDMKTMRRIAVPHGEETRHSHTDLYAVYDPVHDDVSFELSGVVVSI